MKRIVCVIQGEGDGAAELWPLAQCLALDASTRVLFAAPERRITAGAAPSSAGAVRCVPLPEPQRLPEWLGAWSFSQSPQCLITDCSEAAAICLAGSDIPAVACAPLSHAAITRAGNAGHSKNIAKNAQVYVAFSDSARNTVAAQFHVSTASIRVIPPPAAFSTPAELAPRANEMRGNNLPGLWTAGPFVKNAPTLRVFLSMLTQLRKTNPDSPCVTWLTERPTPLPPIKDDAGNDLIRFRYSPGYPIDHFMPGDCFFITFPDADSQIWAWRAACGGAVCCGAAPLGGWFSCNAQSVMWTLPPDEMHPFAAGLLLMPSAGINSQNSAKR